LISFAVARLLPAPVSTVVVAVVAVEVVAVVAM
jgi:hypothetical protein